MENHRGWKPTVFDLHMLPCKGLCLPSYQEQSLFKPLVSNRDRLALIVCSYRALFSNLTLSGKLLAYVARLEFELVLKCNCPNSKVARHLEIELVPSHLETSQVGNPICS